jgi:aspartyl protease family protein
MSRLFIILIGAILATFALVFINRESGVTLGMNNDDFVQLMSLVLLVAAIGVRTIGAGNWGETARNLSIWAIIALVFVAGYQFRAELQHIASRVTLGLVPSRPQPSISANGQRVLVIEKSASGHFEVDTAVNGKDVSFMIDTGASGIVLTLQDARDAGIDTDLLSFSVPVSTANGMSMAAPARLDEIVIGDIIRRNLPALVAPEGKLDQSLLGMDYLNTLSGFSVAQDRLSLQD